MKKFFTYLILLFPAFIIAQNVGIGTNSPDATLHVVDAFPKLKLENATSFPTSIEFGSSVSGSYERIGLINTFKSNGIGSSWMEFRLTEMNNIGMNLSVLNTPVFPDGYRVTLDIIHPEGSLSTADEVGINFLDSGGGTYSSLKHETGHLDIATKNDAIRFRAGFVANQPKVAMLLENSLQTVIIDTTTAPFLMGPRDANSRFDVNGQTETNNIMIRDGAQDGYVLTSDASGKATWAENDLQILKDADGDTRIHVEQFADEDVLRFGVNDFEMAIMDNAGLELNGIFEMIDDGTRHLFINGPRISIENSGNSVFLGNGAGGADDLSLNENTFVGNKSGETNTGIRNTFLGANAGQITTTDSENTFVGYGAGQAAASSKNVFVGSQAGGGNSNTTGENTMIGFQTGQNSSGSRNVFLGMEVGKTTSSSGNTMVGYHAGRSLAGGLGNNTYLGQFAGFSNATGGSNVMIGNSAGFFNNNADGKNTFVGQSAGNMNSGTENVFLGHAAGLESTGSNNVFIGTGAGAQELGSNVFVLQNSITDDPLMRGEFDSNTLVIDGTVRITELIRLKPQTSVPSCANASHRGQVYFDDSAQKLRVCTNTGWVNLH